MDICICFPEASGVRSNSEVKFIFIILSSSNKKIIIGTNRCMLLRKEWCKHYYLFCLNTAAVFVPLPKTVLGSLQ